MVADRAAPTTTHRAIWPDRCLDTAGPSTASLRIANWRRRSDTATCAGVPGIGGICGLDYEQACYERGHEVGRPECRMRCHVSLFLASIVMRRISVALGSWQYNTATPDSWPQNVAQSLSNKFIAACAALHQSLAANRREGSSASFQACVSHFRSSPNTGRIAASRHVT
jgi:hypothetical protein